MPGPFTHIYAQRRVADLLGDGVTGDFVRPADGDLLSPQRLDPDGTPLDPRLLAQAMADWPKFAALGAIGPDIFFFLQDYADPRIPCDEIMFGLSLLYYLDDQGRLDDPYDGLLAILAEISDTWADILIQYLVRVGYADVRTEEPDPWHYLYWIRHQLGAPSPARARRGTRLTRLSTRTSC